MDGMAADHRLPIRRDGKPKWPKADEAADWLRDKGFEIPAAARRHRAGDDAQMEARIAVGMLALGGRQDLGWTQLGVA